MSAPRPRVLSSDPTTQAVLDFDPATAIRESSAAAAAMPAEEKERRRRELEQARLDACEYALASDDPELRVLAAAYLTRPAA